MNNQGYGNHGFDPNDLSGSANNTRQDAGYGSGPAYRPKEHYILLKRKNLVLMVIILLVLSLCVSFGGMYLANSFFGDSGSGENTNVTGSGYKLEKATKSKLSVQDISSKVKNSVVEIKTESVQRGGWVGEYVTQGAGSGVVIKSNGYIITNNHVIEGAGKIAVTINKKTYNAKLVGTDSKNDIAVLKVKAKHLTAVTYGNSNQLSVGDMAVIIGNPLGELGGSVTAGVVSAKDRQVTLNNQTMTLIQTDASVNPGNSGGGMFNDSGQLVGIVVAKSSGENVEGLGFAIPVNTAAKIASDIMKGKSSSGSSSESSNKNGTAFSGMAYQDLTDSQAAKSAGVDNPGIYIQSILTSNAATAGFQVGDMVYSVDGKKISSFSQLKRIITGHKVGDKIKYVIVRGGKKEKITLTLIAQEDYESSQGSDNSNGNGGNSGGNSDNFGNGDNGSGGSLFDFFN